MPEQSIHDLRLYATRHQLAVRMGCSIRSLIRWEQNRGLPSRQVLGGTRKAYFLPEVVEWARSRPDLAKKHREAQLLLN